MTQFEGFLPANTTPVPDVLFDQLLTELSGAELKAMLYVIRRTWGFKKNEDAISLSQFQTGITTKDGRILDKGCGVKDRTTLVKALNNLEKRGYINSKKPINDKGEHEITQYSIRFKGELVGSRESLLGVVGKAYEGGRENGTTPSRENPRGVVGKPDEQETVIQETVIQESVCGDSEKGEVVTTETVPHTPLFEKGISTTVGGNLAPSSPGPAPSMLAAPATRDKPARKELSENGQEIAALLSSAAPRLKAVKREPAHSPEAIAIQKMYDGVALGPGKVSGHPTWDWTAMEAMTAASPTEEEIRLVYEHLKKQSRKCTIQAVWENWFELASLKKPVIQQKKVASLTAEIEKKYNLPPTLTPAQMREKQERIMRQSLARKAQTAGMGVSR